MTKPLLGRVAIITGASRGIGRAAALALAEKGADIAICARGQEIDDVARQASAFGVRVVSRRCDVSDRSKVRAWLREAARRLRRLDVLMNNAGVLGPRMPLATYPSAQFDEVLRVNVIGGFHAMQAALEFSMLKRRSGVIINVSSGAGRIGRSLGGAYTVSKFAIEGMTQVAAAELSSSGIAVCSLCPGIARTPMRAAWAPNEDPLTVNPPEMLGAHFVTLARLKPSQTGRIFSVTPSNALIELPIPGQNTKRGASRCSFAS